MDSFMLLFKLYFGAFIGIGIGFALFGQTDFIQPEPLQVDSLAGYFYAV